MGDDGFALKDANGNKIQESYQYKFDAGDRAFADPLNTIAKSEYEKMKSSEELRNIIVDIGDGQGPRKIDTLTIEEYTKKIHKIKDAMPAEKERFERSNDFESAHANAQAAGSSGKK